MLEVGPIYGKWLTLSVKNFLHTRLLFWLNLVLDLYSICFPSCFKIKQSLIKDEAANFSLIID